MAIGLIDMQQLSIAIVQEKSLLSQQKERIRKTITEVYQEYCEKAKSGKAYSTIKERDYLWNNHLKEYFGKRYIDDMKKLFIYWENIVTCVSINIMV